MHDIRKVLKDGKFLHERIDDRMQAELERQKKAGKKFISDAEIDELIDRIMREELDEKPDQLKKAYKIEEPLVSFETAKLAKVKGFNVPCNEYHNIDKEGNKQEDKPITVGAANYNHPQWNTVSMPRQTLLQRWLREVHNIITVVLPWKDHAADVNDPFTYRPTIVGVKICGEFLKHDVAMEELLQKALELLPNVKTLRV